MYGTATALPGYRPEPRAIENYPWPNKQTLTNSAAASFTSVPLFVCVFLVNACVAAFVGRRGLFYVLWTDEFSAFTQRRCVVASCRR